MPGYALTAFQKPRQNIDDDQLPGAEHPLLLLALGLRHPHNRGAAVGRRRSGRALLEDDGEHEDARCQVEE